jgi:hypothetical protein
MSPRIAMPSLRCLDGLPNKTLLHIFHLLPIGSLTKVCLTNERCNQIATERLYAGIDNYTVGSNIATLGIMNTIVYLNPKLGKLVKRIRIALKDESEWSEQSSTKSEDHDEGDTEDMLSEDEDGNEKNEDNNDEDNCCNNADGERELFVDTLCLVPNLKALDISDRMDMGAEREDLAWAHGWIQVLNAAVTASAEAPMEHF